MFHCKLNGCSAGIRVEGPIHARVRNGQGLCLGAIGGSRRAVANDGDSIAVRTGIGRGCDSRGSGAHPAFAQKSFFSVPMSFARGDRGQGEKLAEHGMQLGLPTQLEPGNSRLTYFFATGW